MEDVFMRGWENFLARTSGPLHFRFFIQPALAIFFAIRAGMKDAREGRPPFLWSVFTNKEYGFKHFKSGVGDVKNVVITGLCMDIIYQVWVLRAVYFLELLFTVTLLAIVPYLLVRGPASRIFKRTQLAH